MSEIQGNPHWRKLHNPKYLGAYSFEKGEKSRILKISNVCYEEVLSNLGANMCTVIYFSNSDKPMICNKTNATAISIVCDSEHVKDWIGHNVEVFVDKVKVKREFVTALRIKPNKPIVLKPKLSPESDRWEGAIKSLKANTISIDKIKSLFDVSDDDIAFLEKAMVVDVEVQEDE